ncbi:MAG: ATP-binding protein [Hyphomicrobiales bacterium]|nr:MAG: ATP-binding protein [Hyphomicrobiales bacterium]
MAKRPTINEGLLAKGGGNATSGGVSMQASVAASIAVQVLVRNSLDSSLGLRTAKPISVLAETEIPVDDIAIETDAKGWVFIQSKNKLSGGAATLTSEFGKTCDEIARLWMLTSSGDGTRGWNRPLQRGQDTIVIAVGPTSSGTYKTHLQQALNALRAGSITTRSDEDKKSLKAFEALLGKAFAARGASSATDMNEVMKFVHVLVFDFDGPDRGLAETRLEKVLDEPDKARAAFKVIEKLCQDTMTARSRCDVDKIRTALAADGLPVRSATPGWREELSGIRRTLDALHGPIQHAEQSTELGADLFRRAVKAFRAEYLVSDIGGVPFGGRDAELERLTDWMVDEKAPPRMLITAPAGRGKSALLVNWLQQLEANLEFANWRRIFVPISIRTKTNRPEVFLAGLARQLAPISRISIPADAFGNAEALRYVVEDQIEAIAADSERLLLVIDGLDEALQDSFNGEMIPLRLPSTLRILLSARWQVGDLDSKGWLKRLGWERNVRVQTYELMKLDAAGICDVLVKLGAPTDVLAAEHSTVEKLAKLTEGEPILVRYYAEDLWNFAQTRARVTREDLDNMQPGFGAYFSRWFAHQEKMWIEQNESVDHAKVDRVLSLLAFALGPLESWELISIYNHLYGGEKIFEEARLLSPLRRFVMGDGRTNSGYVLSHPKIGVYLQNDRFHAASSAMRRGFADWGRQHLEALNLNITNPKDASRYVLQFLNAHFDIAATPAGIRIELVDDGWRRAWEAYDGGARGFARDVQATWNAVRRERYGGIEVQWRCALVLSSIKTLDDGTPNELLLAAVKKRQMSLQQAIHLANIDGRELNGIKLLVDLSQIDGIAASLKRDLIGDALSKIDRCRSDDHRASAVEVLAPHLDRQLSWEALSKIERIIDQERRASALEALIPHISQDFFPRAESIAQKILNERLRKTLLDAIVAQLSPRETIGETYEPREALQAAELTERELSDIAMTSDAVLRSHSIRAVVDRIPSRLALEAFEIARKIVDESDRANVIAALAARSPTVLLKEALTEARALVSRNARAHVLASIACHLPAHLIGEALSIAREIGDQKHRALALAAIAPSLPPLEELAALTYALQIARKIGEEEIRSAVLAQIAGQLSKVPITQIVDTLSEMRDEGLRAHVLTSLAPTLPADAFPEVLLVAQSIADEVRLAGALANLAPYLPNKLIPKVLQMAEGIHDEGRRAHVLSSLAPRLPQALMDRALADAESIKNEGCRARTLSSLAKHLPSTLIGKAVSLANGFNSQEHRAKVLRELAPRMLKHQKVLLRSLDLTDKPKGDGELSWRPVVTPHNVFATGTRNESVALLRVPVGLSPTSSGRLPLDGGETDDDRLNWIVGMLDRKPPLTEMHSVFAVAQVIVDEKKRSVAFVALAGHLPPDLVARALSAAEDIENEVYRADVLWTLLPHLTPILASQALSAARAVGDKRLIEGTVIRVAKAIPQTNQQDWLDVIASTAGNLERPAALALLADSIHLAVELGGFRAAQAILRAVKETAEWYP